jgi:YD repeat-containing protein
MTRSNWRTGLVVLLLMGVLSTLCAGPAWAETITYTYDPLGRVTKVAYDNGASIVYNYDAAGNRTSVVTTAIARAVFHGHIRLPGRTPPPDPSWQVLLQVSFLLPGTTTVAFTAAPTTDASGNFSVSNVPPAAYDVQIKFAQALSKVSRTVVLSAGDNPSVDFEVLSVGDLNNDDGVDILDFSILRTTFGRCTGDTGYDGRADLNGDGCVDIADFSLMRVSFGKFGPEIVSAPNASP